MQRECLDKGIVIVKFRARSFDELLECLLAFGTALHAPMLWRPENHVVISLPEFSGRAMVVIAPLDKTPVDIEDKRFIQGPILG